MDAPSIWDPVPWPAVGLSVLQTFSLYWLLILGIKCAGRRVFGQLGPQDFIVLILIAEACDLGLTPEEGGYWSTVASVLTILATGAITERIAPVRKLLDGHPIELMKDGMLLPAAMKKALVEEGDLCSTARRYGFPDYSVFETMVLEVDGGITGVLKPQYRTHQP